MGCITYSESGILAALGLIIGFLLNCCKQIEGSRCDTITLFYGLVNIHRKPLTADEVVELGEVPTVKDIEEEKTLN